jgi:hypothetical protein
VRRGRRQRRCREHRRKDKPQTDFHEPTTSFVAAGNSSHPGVVCPVDNQPAGVRRSLGRGVIPAPRQARQRGCRSECVTAVSPAASTTALDGDGLIELVARARHGRSPAAARRACSRSASPPSRCSLLHFPRTGRFPDRSCRLHRVLRARVQGSLRVRRRLRGPDAARLHRDVVHRAASGSSRS